MPVPRQTKVKVFLRSRPCENFANDMIEYGSDGKVRYFDHSPSDAILTN